MKPLASSTLKTRIRVLREYVGFVVKWLLGEPTMEHVMCPNFVSKYLGFLDAKGIAKATMKKTVNHLGQTVGFVTSLQFPTPKSREASWLRDVGSWYGNVQGGLHQQIRLAKAHIQPKLFSLWSAMQYANAKWADFKHAYVSNHGAFTVPLARQCMECGLRLCMMGCHQPPLREGMVRVLHSHSSSSPCVCEDCDAAECPKNHVIYFKDRKGMHGEMFVVHFKNSNTKGEQLLALSNEMLEVCVLLEKAARFVNSPTLFYATNNNVFEEHYFSQVCSKLLSFGTHHITANTMRHMYVTHWKDYIHHPSTQLFGLGVEQLTLEAASLMLNSPAAWVAAYDDSLFDRSMSSTISHWPKFLEFVK